MQELWAHIVADDPVPPRQVDPRIPRDLETVVLRAMDKDRDKRYQRAVDLAEGDGERSFFWWAYARGSRSIVLDLESAADREALLRLVDGADVSTFTCLRLLS